MTKRQTDALNTIIAALPDESRTHFREVAECAISLGYMPSLKGARKDYADFTKSKVKRTILKINADPKFAPGLAMKFYAVPEYGTSAFFQKAVEDRHNTWKRMNYEARCFGCGKCDGTEGYKVALPDGKQGFLCGFGLLPLPPLNEANVAEVKDALKAQDKFFTDQKQ